MNVRSYILTVMLAGAAVASAQVVPLATSHAPALNKPGGAMPAAPGSTNALKPVARVNGAVLTEMDLLREMRSIFPYAQQHNGIPKEMEPQIRKGAMEMMVFEELLYQEAKRSNVGVSPERLARAEAAFRKQFPTRAMYEQHIRTELSGSRAALREKIRRSLLIEKMLKTEVEQKSAVTVAAAKAYYDKNAKQFEHGETVSIQTISIVPPPDASREIKEEAYYKIKDALRLAKQTKDYKAFGLLAEQISDDDWHTKFGDRGAMEVSKLPPEVGKAARSLKPGEISGIVQVGSAYVILRLNEHAPAGRTPFAKVKAKLQSDLQKQKTEETRAALNQKLRKHANIELL